MTYDRDFMGLCNCGAYQEAPTIRTGGCCPACKRIADLERELAERTMERDSADEVYQGAQYDLKQLQEKLDRCSELLANEAVECGELKRQLVEAKADLELTQAALDDAAGAVEWGAEQAGPNRLSPEAIEMFRDTLKRVRDRTDYGMPAQVRAQAARLREALERYRQEYENPCPDLTLRVVLRKKLWELLDGALAGDGGQEKPTNA